MITFSVLVATGSSSDLSIYPFIVIIIIYNRRGGEAAHGNAEEQQTLKSNPSPNNQALLAFCFLPPFVVFSSRFLHTHDTESGTGKSKGKGQGQAERVCES